MFTSPRRIVASPPLFRLMPGASRLCVLPDTANVSDAAEATYRLFLQEVPAAPKGDTEGGSQLKMLLRLPAGLRSPVAPQPESMLAGAPQ